MPKNDDNYCRLCGSYEGSLLVHWLKYHPALPFTPLDAIKFERAIMKGRYYSAARILIKYSEKRKRAKIDRKRIQGAFGQDVKEALKRANNALKSHFPKGGDPPPDPAP